MDEFMVIVMVIDGVDCNNVGAKFYDTYREALSYAQAAECVAKTFAKGSVKLFWQIYHWNDDSYKLFQENR